MLHFLQASGHIVLSGVLAVVMSVVGVFNQPRVITVTSTEQTAAVYENLAPLPAASSTPILVASSTPTSSPVSVVSSSA